MCLIKRAQQGLRGILAILTLASLFILTSCTWYNNAILDNKDQTLPCGQLPTEQEVAKVLTDHQDVVKRILAVNPGQVFVDVDTITCPSHASIEISYAAHRDRVAIEEIIAADMFFGVPYQLRNR